jgi:hypothetical protein
MNLKKSFGYCSSPNGTAQEHLCKYHIYCIKMARVKVFKLPFEINSSQLKSKIALLPSCKLISKINFKLTNNIGRFNTWLYLFLIS